MLTIEEWRQILGPENVSEAETEEFVKGLRNFLDGFLDDYFRDEFAPDDV
jgi:hypothetical protein